MNTRVAHQKIGYRAAGLSLAVLSCADLAGIDEYRTANVPESGAHGGFTFKNSVCGGCMAESCGRELEACQADELCKQWLACAALCEDGPCEFRCYQETEHTTDVLGAVIECQSRACTPAACEISWGAQLGEGVADCARSSCRDLITDCAADEQCRQTSRCYFAEDCTANGNPACVATCNDLHDVYTPTSLALRTGTCVGQSCLNVLEHDLGCSGYSWPAATQPKIVVQALVHLSPLPEAFGPGAPGEDNGPMPGVSIRACRMNDPDCSDPDGLKPTDENGVVTFELAPFARGWEGYFRLTISDGACTQDMIHQLSRPLNRDTRLSVPVSLRWKMRCEPDPNFIPWQAGKSRLLVVARDCNGFALAATSLEVVGGGGEPEQFPAVLPPGLALANVEPGPGLRRVRVFLEGRPIAEQDVVLAPNAFTRMFWLNPL